MKKKDIRESKLWQIFCITFNDEQFCFSADNENEARVKFNNWLRYHDFLRIREQFCLNKVNKPRHRDNIHDEWVNKEKTNEYK